MYKKIWKFCKSLRFSHFSQNYKIVTCTNPFNLIVRVLVSKTCTVAEGQLLKILISCHVLGLNCVLRQECPNITTAAVRCKGTCLWIFMEITTSHQFAWRDSPYFQQGPYTFFKNGQYSCQGTHLLGLRQTMIKICHRIQPVTQHQTSGQGTKVITDV